MRRRIKRALRGKGGLGREIKGNWMRVGTSLLPEGSKNWSIAGTFFLLLTGTQVFIDRRGEKIAPAEIDGILLSHKAVAEAVCFGVPDEMFGQEIHAAVVLKQGSKVTEKELQSYIAEKVAKFKIPKKVNVVGMPKGLTDRFILQRKFRRLPRGRYKEPKSVKPSLSRKQNCKCMRIAENLKNIVQFACDYCLFRHAWSYVITNDQSRADSDSIPFATNEIFE